MKFEYQLLDVFTDRKFGGNQLAVFTDAQDIDPELFQPIARELNLSETVFLLDRNPRGATRMRIFTPASELPTAGHPTIGTAFVLSQAIGGNETIQLQLEQKVGLINVEVEMEADKPKMATMNQILPSFGKVYDERSRIARLLGLEESDLLHHPIQQVSCGVPYIIVPVQTLDAIRKIQFRHEVWDQMREYLDNQAIYAFAPEGERVGSNLHGRMFAPEIGIVEDPATGSANGPLACYLSEHNIINGPLVSEQGFEMGRPSILHLEVERNESQITKVRVGGQAVFVGHGALDLS